MPRRRLPAARLAAAAVLTVTGAGPALAQNAPPTIWIEGENPVRADVTPHSWYDQVNKADLSGGGWLSNFGSNASMGQAAYRIDPPEAGVYRLYFRVNPVRASYRYRIGSGGWQTLNTETVFDQSNIAADGKPDLRFIGWVDAGRVTLPARPQTLAVQIDGEVDHHGAIDAIVLTANRDWTPQGTHKPGEARPADTGAPGTWAFNPPRDRFADDALLDLSWMNEDVAGEHGFIRVDDQGDFVNDAGLIRFWAIGDSVYRRGMEALQENAKFIAKRGVNMVRWHGNLPPRNPQRNLNEPNEQALDELFQYVAAMKQEGIYLTVSPYYAHSTNMGGNDGQALRNAWGLPRNPEAANTGSLLFFDPKLQAAYKDWVRAMMTRRNPYTGIALKDEPAVAIFQIQNEDSLLFWTVNGLTGGDREILRRQFGDWLKRKYGSLAAARKAWNGVDAQGGQSPSNWQTGSIEISNVWAWFQPNLNQGGLGKRMTDEAEFVVGTMKAWNDEVERFLREDVGAKQVINAGNWKTADPLRLNDLERYSYAGQDVIGVNRYTGAMHEGPNRGWAVVKGDRFQSRSITLSPGELPVGLKQVQGKAMIIPEGNWVPPNGFQSEGPFLVAAYSGLNGVDALFWFNMGQIQWRQPSSANGYLDSIGKWVIETPGIMGNFPAAALMYRMGYIERGEPVVVEHRRLESLWKREAPIISEEGTFDPNRDAQDISDQPVNTAVDQKAFVVGPVEVVYGSDPSQTRVANLDRYIDEQGKVVRSVTGQHRWDYGQGLVYVDTPKAQGVTGYLNRKDPHELTDVTITSDNDYATVAVVAMDDRPIRESSKLLIQVGTMARPTGWKEREVEPAKNGPEPVLEIVEHGAGPWRVTDSKVSVSVRNPTLSKATAVDANGEALEALDLETVDGAVKLVFPRDAMYVVMQ